MEWNIWGINGNWNGTLLSKRMLKCFLIALGQHFKTGIISRAVWFVISTGLVVDGFIWIALLVINTILILAQSFFQRDRNKLNKIWIKNRVMRVEERRWPKRVYRTLADITFVFRFQIDTNQLYSLTWRFLRLFDFFSDFITLTYWKAASIRPPLQPWLPSGFEQSTRFCSDRSGRVPKWIFMWPSSAPVDEKAQHDPHCPKFRRT